jgi:aryl-alcohol dehydrogenase-like predicted oxidoreductase
MQYTTLGKTGLKVSVAGLGCGGFSRLGIPHGKTEDEAARLIHEAVDLGINLLDTAPVYGTEAVVGKALKSIRGTRSSSPPRPRCTATRNGTRPSAWSRAWTIHCG